MRIHELKTDAEVFAATALGMKAYEVREDDRGFEVGDVLFLRETRHTGEEMRVGEKPLIYTGRHEMMEVTHILRGPIYGLLGGWVIMSCRRVKIELV